MSIMLQKGVSSTGIDIFTILYHIWLYYRVGISKQTKWSQIALSFINFILLRQCVLWTIPFINFNFEYTNRILFVIFQVGVFYLIQELYMYFIHRLLHWSKLLYTWVHRQHHLLKAECFTTASYMSPIEIIIHIYPNVILGPIIFNYYNGYILKESFIIWMCLAIFYFVWSHSGVSDLKYMPSVKHHWLHHKYYNVNYGTWLTDGIFRTIRYED